MDSGALTAAEKNLMLVSAFRKLYQRLGMIVGGEVKAAAKVFKNKQLELQDYKKN